MRLAYADPPYPGQAQKHYGRDFDVNHEVLIGTLMGYDGWALSTSSRALRHVLPLCPDSARVGAWCKPFAAMKKNVVPTYAWEPVIFVPSRKRILDKKWATMGASRDWIAETPPIFRGEYRGVPGCKPLRFCWWVLDLIAFNSGDTIDDLFPGSGIMAEAVESYRKQRELFAMATS